MESQSVIQGYYEKRNVLITGATGFVGKALIEKLLRSCPEIGNIYVLIRPKGDKDVKERLQELLNNSLFSVVKKQSPTLLQKVIPIVDDVDMDNLGLSPKDMDLICDEVSIVFHSAAVVKFDSHLRTAVNINVLGTRRVLELCRKMKHLEALVYMSTAYSNSDRVVIDEIVYSMETDYNEVIKLVEATTYDMLQKITPELIGDKPNVYTFTKAMAEELIITEGKGLPICIVRPSVVTGASKEPMEGWIDNLNGASGLLAAIGKGLVRTIYFKGNINANFIPIDLLTNFSICAAWNLGQTRPKNIPVYNCCIGSKNVLPWANLVEWMCKYCMQYPFSDAIWFPYIATNSNVRMTQLSHFVTQYLPAYFMDQMARVKGQEPRMLLKYAKMKKALSALDFFGNHSWYFQTCNVDQLYAKLTPEDRTLFDFNVKNVKWEPYIVNYVLGVRRYVFNDADHSLPTARLRVRRMLLIQKGIQFIFLVGLWTLGFIFLYKYCPTFWLFVVWVLIFVWYAWDIPNVIDVLY